MRHESAAARLPAATVPSLCYDGSRGCHDAAFGSHARASHLHSMTREVRMMKSLLLSVAALGALALVACTDDSQTTQRGIDQDITATHDAGAPTLSNIGQNNFAPWRLNMAP